MKAERKKKKKPGNQEPMPEAEVGSVLREAGPRRRGEREFRGEWPEGLPRRTPVA
jgi:hypothetical protein